MSAIPNLSHANVEAALALIDNDGVPPRRASRDYHLVAGGKRYPPKYVLSLAVADATGRELRWDAFSGGNETNEKLLALGFSIEGPNGPVRPPSELSRIGESALVAVRVGEGRSEVPSSSADVDIVRIVVRGKPASSPRAARDMLLEAFEERWPDDLQAKFATTPGGYLCGVFPDRWAGGVAWESTNKDIEDLIRIAEPLLRKALTPRVLKAARRRTCVLTLGLDLNSDAQHVELVAVIDTSSGDVVRWTGKSYPTPAQERDLVQVSDVGSHLIEIAGERVLVLGCHDLNMYSARARANQNPDGARRGRCDRMASATARFRPTVVLQHPHSTDSAQIWRMPWACLLRDYPTVRSYASGIGYYVNGGRPRQSLTKVMEGTRSETGVVDVVIRSR